VDTAALMANLQAQLSSSAFRAPSDTRGLFGTQAGAMQWSATQALANRMAQDLRTIAGAIRGDRMQVEGTVRLNGL
jgi:hypothetical protein